MFLDNARNALGNTKKPLSLATRMVSLPWQTEGLSFPFATVFKLDRNGNDKTVSLGIL